MLDFTAQDSIIGVYSAVELLTKSSRKGVLIVVMSSDSIAGRGFCVCGCVGGVVIRWSS